MLSRFLRSTICRTRQFSYKIHNEAISNKKLFQEEYNELNAYFPQIVKNVCEKDYMLQFSNVSERYKFLMNYAVNVQRPSHLSICLLALYAYKEFEKPELLTEENLKKVYGVCWAIRMLEGCAILIDDIIDDGAIRYDKDAYWKLEGEKNTILDSLFLEYSGGMYLYEVLKDHPNYTKITQLVKDDFNRLNVGQLMDLRRVGEKNPIEIYEARLIKGDYLMHLPVRTAMYLANINKEYHQKIDTILRNISRFSVIQNDFWDIYNPDKEVGKECNDISQGKVTWFYVKAMEIASPSQMKIINENYGTPCQESVKTVEKIYEDLKIEEVYEEYTEEYFKKLHTQIEQLPDDFPKYFFHDCIWIFKKGFMNG